MRASGFISDCVYLLYQKCHKINPNRGGSQADSFNWIINKKAMINLINCDNKCFQSAVTISLSHEEIENTKKNIQKEYKKGLKHLSRKDDWENFEKNSPIIVPNTLLVKKEKIYPPYVSKQNSKREKQVILLMIPNGEK